MQILATIVDMRENKDEGAYNKHSHDSEQIKNLKECPEAGPMAHESRLLNGILMAMYMFVKRVHSLLEHVKFRVLTLANGNSFYASCFS